MGDDRDDRIVDRLEGTYSLGPFGERSFASSDFVPPIQIEAAAHIRRIEGENVRLRRLLREALTAVNSAHLQTDAEWRGHDRVERHHGEVVEAFRREVRETLRGDER